MDNNSINRPSFSVIADMLRFPLIYLVVVIHMTPLYYPRVSLDFTEGNMLYVFITELISHNFGAVAVPCYFFISGYYFFNVFKGLDKLNFSIYKSVLSKKIRTVFFPYFFWNTMLIFAFWIKNRIFIQWGKEVDYGFLYLKETNFFDWYWKDPVNFPLWYMRDLIVMICIWPFFYYLFRYLKVYGIIPLLLLLVAFPDTGIPGLGSTAMAFFGMGAMFSYLRLDVLAFSKRYKWIFGFLTIVLLFCSTLLNGETLHPYILNIYALCAVWSLFNIFSKLSQNEYVKKYSLLYAEASFLVYVIHEIYIINWLKGFWVRVAGEDLIVMKFLGYFLIPVVCTILCVVIFKVWKKISPNSLAFVTGGRIGSHGRNRNE